MIYIKNGVEVSTEPFGRGIIVAGMPTPHEDGRAHLNFHIPVEFFFFEILDGRKYRAGIHVGINAYKAAESLHDFYERGEI